jgi:hypothetical protein
VRDMILYMDTAIIAKADTEIEGAAIRTVVMGDVYLKAGDRKEATFSLPDGDKGKVLLTFLLGNTVALFQHQAGHLVCLIRVKGEFEPEMRGEAHDPNAGADCVTVKHSHHLQEFRTIFGRQIGDIRQNRSALGALARASAVVETRGHLRANRQ